MKELITERFILIKISKESMKNVASNISLQKMKI